MAIFLFVLRDISFFSPRRILINYAKKKTFRAQRLHMLRSPVKDMVSLVRRQRSISWSQAHQAVGLQAMPQFPHPQNGHQSHLPHKAIQGLKRIVEKGWEQVTIFRGTG